MEITLTPKPLGGTVAAIPSKSEAHRLLLCAALSDAPTEILCDKENDDIRATVDCLTALGAKIQKENDRFLLSPIGETKKEPATLLCKESGSTLRFLLPVTAALGRDAYFYGEGRLFSRPLSPLYELLISKGIHLSPQGTNPLFLSGTLSSGDFSIDGSVSSQFISGLLFALSIAKGESLLSVTGKVESAEYIHMTVNALRTFGANIKEEAPFCYRILGKKRLSSPEIVTVGGDWSNAAFFLAGGAIGKRSVTVTGLRLDSTQGDKEILSILSRFGAKVDPSQQSVTASPAPLSGIDIDGSMIPDLIPILSVVAACAKGVTRFFHVERLKLKESDRIEAILSLLLSLGGKGSYRDGTLTVEGCPLQGGTVSSFSDHRIAMSAAVAASAARGPVTIVNAEAVNKSYPQFFEDYHKLTEERL